MGLVKKFKVEEKLLVGLWRIEETIAELSSQLSLSKADRERISVMNDRRKTEWLAARVLLQTLTSPEVKCLHDEYGKPFLEGSPYFISISHSRGLVALILSEQEVGVDVQLIVPKIKRIGPKFMRAAESETLHKGHEVEHLHVYWGAKEALYKAYGKRALDFRRHILIQPFFYDHAGRFSGRVEKEDFRAVYDIFYEKLEDYILVYAYQAPAF